MSDPARDRFFAIQAVRIAGVVQVVIGMLIAAESIALPAWAGYVLLANGLIDTFVIPLLLARRWRSPR
ncbi:hypothetical protein B2G71_06450 [Novosphingobium sp. PC22D]|uniref:hypothetical protein n=1 Tax=Novosphingobium sp. PC22D TaxID=1962403 RepID=UPI000BF00394|nr:hypothetical protein [Novosphingobium sp. PC22D]PEQ13936.1 hypothetical protein B2G71_06450 [Novosphingobium sp. PC22D]